MKKILLLLAIAFLFILRFWMSRPVYGEGDWVRISTRVTSEPSHNFSSQTIKLKGLRVTFPDYWDIGYGDYLVVEGRVKDNQLEETKIINIQKTENLFIKLRRHVVAFYQKNLPEPHASLLSGIVLGSKEGITQEFKEILRATGTAHVVVASGMNATLTAGFLLTLFLTVVSRRQAATFSIVGVWVYTFMSGLEAPIVRAAIMATIALGATFLGRLYVAQRALLVTVLLMLLINPDWLFDLGFQLSFVATASLMIFESKIARLIHFVPGIFREGLATSLAAQIGVAPIIFVTFGQFSAFSPLINALVLWTVAPIMVIGAVSGLMSLFCPVLASYILYLAYPLTYFFVWVVSNTSSAF